MVGHCFNFFEILYLLPGLVLLKSDLEVSKSLNTQNLIHICLLSEHQIEKRTQHVLSEARRQHVLSEARRKHVLSEARRQHVLSDARRLSA